MINAKIGVNSPALYPLFPCCLSNIATLLFTHHNRMFKLRTYAIQWRSQTPMQKRTVSKFWPMGFKHKFCVVASRNLPQEKLALGWSLLDYEDAHLPIRTSELNREKPGILRLGGAEPASALNSYLHFICKKKINLFHSNHCNMGFLSMEPKLILIPQLCHLGSLKNNVLKFFLSSVIQRWLSQYHRRWS